MPHCDSLSAAAKGQALRICCAYDMWVTKRLLTVIQLGRGGRSLPFRIRPMRSGGTSSFLFECSCRKVIEAYRFHLHLSPLPLSLWSTTCLHSFCVPDTVGFPLIYIWKILLLLCKSLYPQPSVNSFLSLFRFAFGLLHDTDIKVAVMYAAQSQSRQTLC